MKQPLVGDVHVSGVINDQEFRATGQVGGDPQTGRFRAELDYEHVPQHWHPLMYTDVKAGLLFPSEEGRARNFLSAAGGVFTAAGVIDFGQGDILRNHAVIELLDEHRFRAAYVMHGSARTGPLKTLASFRETMVPFGPGRVGAIALARWITEEGEDLEATFSTRFSFPNGGSLLGVQLRSIVAQPHFAPGPAESVLRQGGRFTCDYEATVKEPPAAGDLSSLPDFADLVVG